MEQEESSLTVEVAKRDCWKEAKSETTVPLQETEVNEVESTTAYKNKIKKSIIIK